MTDAQNDKPAKKNYEPSASATPKAKPARSRFRRYLPGLLFLAVLGGAIYLVWRIFFASAGGPENLVTLSGRIEGDPSAVASKVSGRILEIRVREGDVVVMPKGYHPNVAAPGGQINFLWMMAAIREGEDRLFGVVKVQPEFDTGVTGLEGARGK